MDPHRARYARNLWWRQVRGKVAVSLAASAARMSPGQWAGYNAEPLLRAAGKLVGDNTPEARDSARRLVALLRDAFEASAAAAHPSRACDAPHVRTPLS